MSKHYRWVLSFPNVFKPDAKTGEPTQMYFGGFKFAVAAKQRITFVTLDEAEIYCNVADASIVITRLKERGIAATPEMVSVTLEVSTTDNEAILVHP